MSLEVLSTQVDNVIKTLDELRDDLKKQNAGAVPRLEWEQRNRFVDERFQGQGREIGELRRMIEGRRPQWPAVLSSVVAAISVTITVVVLISNNAGI